MERRDGRGRRRDRSCTISVSTTAILLFIGSFARAQTVEYIHTDALGSPVAVTDANGAVIERTVYEPYGAVINRPLNNRPGYTGHVEDAVTGLNYMQQRYYDPELGRFLSVDPIEANGLTGANFNRYKYALNNPYKFTDPDGRCESISTCQMMRDDLDLLNGRITEEEYRDRQVARGAGAVAGAAIVVTRGRVLAAGLANKSVQQVLSNEAKRGIRSLEKRIQEHIKKLEEFKKNPTVRPGMEDLPQEVIEKQQKIRIKHLEDEIKTFRENIEKLKNPPPPPPETPPPSPPPSRP